MKSIGTYPSERLEAVTYLVRDESATSEPKFSVIITTYNRASLIGRAISSLISQKEKDWEAIIVDDGSTDNSFTVIKSYLNPEQRIRYFRIPHSGGHLAKNFGIKKATGKYITFLDSDDEYHPDHLALRLRYLEQNPGIRFLHGGAKVLGNKYVPDIDDPSVAVDLSKCVIGGTYVIERRALISLGGYRNITLGADRDLFNRALREKIPVSKVDYPTYIYHHENPDSVTNILFKGVKNQ